MKITFIENRPKRMRLKSVSIFLASVFLFSSGLPVLAVAPSCKNLFIALEPQSSGLSKQLDESQVEQKLLQMFKYETENNDPFYAIPFQKVPIEMVEVPVSSLKIEAFTEEARKSLEDLTYENKKGVRVFLWPKHPFNEDKSVAYSTRKVVQVCDDCYNTSSRSILNKRGLYTFKLSTDHPQAGKPSDPEKLDSLANAKVSEALNPVILALEKKEPSSGYILIDDLIVYPKSQPKHAFLGRSYERLLRSNPDKTYLGASSVMEFAPEWAKKFNMSETDFRIKYWAKPLGRLEADLAIKYGIMLDSPHEQNFLMELDQSGQPTGQLAVRDVSDIYIRPEFAIGNTIKKLHADLNKDGDFDQFKAFDFSFGYISWLRGADASAIHKAHQQAFLQRVKQLLRVDELPIVGQWKDERVETSQGWVTKSPDYNNEWSRLIHILENIDNQGELAKKTGFNKIRQRIIELQGG